MLQRRGLLHGLLAGSAGIGLAGCGFRLRGSGVSLAFQHLRLNAAAETDVVDSLRAQLESSGVQVSSTRAPAPSSTPDVVLDVLQDQRERVVVGTTAAGQVRELQLRWRFRFRLRTGAGQDVIPALELLQERELSFSETDVLGKEAEEALLYSDMRASIVRQVMGRLAAVRRP